MSRSIFLYLTHHSPQITVDVYYCFPSYMYDKQLHTSSRLSLPLFVFSDGAMAMTGSALVGGVLLAVIEGVGILMNRFAAASMQNSK